MLDKPLGMTSNAALQKVRYLMYAEKAGHTGSLDPLATGVLPICLGEATKFTQFLLDADKRYRATFRFGMTTASGDADGEFLSHSGSDNLVQADVETAMEHFRGEIEQVPSMYSALKHQGQPLYKLARQGREVERQPRQVTIYQLELKDFRPGNFAEADIEVHCSKGTYIRTLAEDIGSQLGCGAYVSQLHRSASGPFDERQCISLVELEKLREQHRAEELEYLLLPVDAGIEHLPKVELDNNSAFYFQQGQAVMHPQVYRFATETDIVRVFCEGGGETGQFLGTGEVTDDGKIAPRRVVVR